MMPVMKKLLNLFRNDQRGAIAHITLCAAIPLTLMMFYMVNSAKAVNDHTRNQDGVDMAVLAHAAEGARAMNTIAMNQVSLTQAWTVTATAGTLNDLIKAQYAVLALQQAAILKNGASYCSTGFFYWDAFCWGRLAIPEGIIISHGIRNYKIDDKYNPGDSYDTGRKSMIALNNMNNAVVDRYAKAAGATASLVAKSANVEDLYFDDHCTSDCGEADIELKDHRIGMSLPVDKNLSPTTELNFCVALHYGTAGLSMDLPFDLPGVDSIGASLKNGSYIKRKFENFHGPMRAGKGGTDNMTDYINEETGIGELLADNYDFSRDNWLWVLTSTWDELKGGWPTKQKKDDNYFTQWMTLKTAIACLASQSGLGDIIELVSTLGGLTSEIPNYDLFHPKGVSIVEIFPSTEDFTEDYKILGFTYRRPNKRWASSVFKDPNQGFYSYAQGLIYNPDEIGLYSQNWQAKLIPAKRMENQLSAITGRMESNAPETFSDLKSDLDLVKSESSWSEVVAK